MRINVFSGLGRCAAASLLLATGLAWATTIAVPDASFESPDVADGGNAALPASWSVNGPGALGGLHDQLSGQYAGASGNGAPLPGDADGYQDAYLYFPSPSTAFGYLFADNLVATAANTSYLLIVALGNRLDADTGDVTLGLTVNDVLVASRVISGASIADGTFTDYSLALAGAPTGQLGIVLGMRGVQDHVVQANFDNVRLLANPRELPAPGTLLLLASAALVRRKYAASAPSE